jgi:hypothetical protein
MVFKKILVLLLFIPSFLIASEVDHYTVAPKLNTLRDSKEIINSKANETLSMILKKVNKRNKGCNEKKLYKALRKSFNHKIIGKFAKFITKDKSIHRMRPSIRDSIFEKWNVKDTFTMGFLAKISSPIGYLVNYDGHVIGDDKFEHMFASGFKYFRSYYLQNKPLPETLVIGIKEESGFLGLKVNGVFSYGDLVADFQGMRFWNHFLGRRNDIFGENIVPYVTCDNNKWKPLNKIDFSIYVDEGMDESINCSQVKTASMANKIETKVRALELKRNKSYSCFPGATYQSLYTKYFPFSEYLLNPMGRGVYRGIPGIHNL